MWAIPQNSVPVGVETEKIMEAVRLSHFVVRVRTQRLCRAEAYGTITKLRVIWQMLPRNVGRALSLLCPHCETPRRHV